MEAGNGEWLADDVDVYQRKRHMKLITPSSTTFLNFTFATIFRRKWKRYRAKKPNGEMGKGNGSDRHTNDEERSCTRSLGIDNRETLLELKPLVHVCAEGREVTH